MNKLEIKGGWNITTGKIHPRQAAPKAGFALEG